MEAHVTFDTIRLPPELEGKFKSLMDESERTYHYPNMTRTIKNPVALYIKDTGSHYVIDRNGDVHYLPPGFEGGLTWTPTSEAEYHMAW